MSSMKFSPYIYFKGNCREAMEFYRDVFGGELNLLTYSQTGQAMGSMGADKIMHAALSSGSINIFASDTENASGKASKISLQLTGEAEDGEKLKGIFNKLKEGGAVFSELKKEFWGDTFGSLTDKFGIDWQLNIAAAQEES